MLQSRKIWPEFMARLPDELPVTVIRNKADMTGEPVEFIDNTRYPLIRLSAREEKALICCAIT